MSYSTIMQNILSPILYLSGDPKRKDIKILYDYSNSIFDKFLIKFYRESPFKSLRRFL